MLVEVLPEWTNDTADRLSRAVDRTSLPKPPESERRVLLFMSKQVYRSILAIRNMVRGATKHGFEAKSFIASFEPVADALAELEPRIDHIEQNLRTKTWSPLTSKLLASIVTSKDELVETRAYLAKFLKAAKAPLPPINPESIRRGLDDAAAGRVQDSLAILKRLQSGGDF